MDKEYYPAQNWHPVGEVLREILRDLELERGLIRERIGYVWREAVGEAIAQVTQPEYLKFHTLYVRVSDSVWLHQLSCYHDLIRDKLNERLGEDLVHKIRFRLGEIE